MRFSLPQELNLLSVPHTSKENQTQLTDVQKLTEAQKDNTQLRITMEGLQAEVELVKQEKESVFLKEALLQQELATCRLSAEEELKKQQQFILSLQQMIAEQKNQIEKKQQQIGALEDKVNDLTYEIKTLLHIAEAHTNSVPIEQEKTIDSNSELILEAGTCNDFPHEKQICTPEEASLQLRRCLDIAQKITGSNRFSQMKAFLDSPADSFSIDLRRLCENLRCEKSCAILFYSPRENQLLFANSQIKPLTGWNPEKFVQNFSRIIVDEQAWKNGVASLALRNEVQLKLFFKTNSGQEAELNAHLGMIPTGIFKYHTLAVLY